MVAMPSHSVFAVLLSDAGVERDPTQPATQEPLPRQAAPELSEELGAEPLEIGDWDPADRYDDYGDWKEDYADAVGISSWREL